MNPVIEELERKVDEARKMLKLWEAALTAARQAEESPARTTDRISERAMPRRTTGKPTLISVVEKLLETHGPMSAKELFPLLEESGKTTTLNSLNVSLNRYKGKRFARNDEGKWYLLSHSENKAENS